MSENKERQGRTRGRSPAYPAINLEKAIQRVEQLYRRDKRYPIPVASLADIWGYANLNGPAASIVSALKKFGLVDDEGSKAERMVTVTDRAVSILHNPDAAAKAQAVRDAALEPLIHRDMWELYGPHLPSDSTLEWRLVRERSFTETGAGEFIKEWRETMAFAKLGEDDAERVDVPNRDEPRSPEESSDERENEQDTRAADPSAVERTFAWRGGRASDSGGNAALQSYPIPIALTGRPPVMVSGSFPLSEVEWTQFMAVLTAMRPVLVGEPQVPEADGS